MVESEDQSVCLGSLPANYHENATSFQVGSLIPVGTVILGIENLVALKLSEPHLWSKAWTYQQRSIPSPQHVLHNHPGIEACGMGQAVDYRAGTGNDLRTSIGQDYFEDLVFGSQVDPSVVRGNLLCTRGKRNWYPIRQVVEVRDTCSVLSDRNHPSRFRTEAAASNIPLPNPMLIKPDVPTSDYY